MFLSKWKFFENAALHTSQNNFSLARGFTFLFHLEVVENPDPQTYKNITSLQCESA